VTDTDPKLLHIVNGDRAAGTFLHTFGATDRLLIHRDILSCGPLPRCTTASAWQKLRLDFWRNALAYLRTYDFEPSPIDLLKNAQRLRDDVDDALPPCVWAGTANSDQLLISFVLHLVTMSGADVANVHIVQFETHPATGRRVRGTGELSLDEMRAHPAPRKLSAFELAAYRDAWVAVTSPDPVAMTSFASRHSQAPWYIQDAVGKVLRRFPDRATGLNYWDRHLLQGVRDKGPAAAAVVARTVDAMTVDGDLVGDLYTFSRLLEMSSGALAQPLLQFSGSRQQMGRAEVRLTEFGEQVANGAASSYPVNPIDDWAGGVHLSSANGNLWFDENGAIVRA
jgi:hypothetical protein